MGAAEPDLFFHFVDAAQTDVHAVTGIAVGVILTKGFHYRAVKAFQDLRRTQEMLSLYDLLQQKVAYHAHHCSRNPVTCTVSRGDVKIFTRMVHPGKVTAYDILREIDHKTLGKF